MIYAAIRSGCSAELTGLLLGYGADPHIPGPDGRSPYVLAVTQGRTGLAMLLRQHSADVAVTVIGSNNFRSPITIGRHQRIVQRG